MSLGLSWRRRPRLPEGQRLNSRHRTGDTSTALVEQTGQTGARGTRSTFERKSLPNDRGASARLTRGPECTALIKGRLELRSLSFLPDRTSAVGEPEFLNAVDKTWKSLEPKLSGAAQRHCTSITHDDITCTLFMARSLKRMLDLHCLATRK